MVIGVTEEVLVAVDVPKSIANGVRMSAGVGNSIPVSSDVGEPVGIPDGVGVPVANVHLLISLFGVSRASVAGTVNWPCDG